VNTRTHTHRCHVDGGRGLVHDEDAALPHEGPGQTEELPLAEAEVLSSFGDHGVWRETETLRNPDAQNN